MPRSHRPRSSQPASFPQRIARCWREGVVIANLSVAGYLAQLPRIEDAIFGPGMLTTLGIGVGSGLGWMVLRGAFTGGSPEREDDDEQVVAPRRTGSRSLPSRPSARSVAPRARPSTASYAQGARAPSQPPPQPPSRAPSQPPPRRTPSSHPYAHAQSGQTMMDGFPSPFVPPAPPPVEQHSQRPEANQLGSTLHGHAAHPSNHPGSTLHGYASVPPPAHPSAPAASAPRLVPASSPPHALSATRPGGFAAVSSLPHDALPPTRPSGPPTMRMTALQEAELAGSPAAPSPAEIPSGPPARLSWPPAIELSQESRSGRTREPSLPPPKVPMAAIARRVPTPPPANDAVVAAYIDTVGEPALTLGVNSSLPPDQRDGARAAIQRRIAAQVEVIQGEANPPSEQLDPELVDQLEELRAEVLTMSPSQCFVVGISSDAEHMTTKSALAVQLALQLAQSGSRRVLLVEANATRPMLNRALELYVPLAAGFSQQMHRRMTAISPTWMVLRVAPTLDVLAEGRFRTPGMLYGSVFAVALHELRDHYDVIVADGPVVETHEAAAAFAQVVDGIGYLTSGLPSIRVPRERALAKFRGKPLFKVLTTR